MMTKCRWLAAACVAVTTTTGACAPYVVLTNNTWADRETAVVGTGDLAAPVYSGWCNAPGFGSDPATLACESARRAGGIWANGGYTGVVANGSGRPGTVSTSWGAPRRMPGGDIRSYPAGWVWAMGVGGQNTESASGAAGTPGEWAPARALNARVAVTDGTRILWYGSERLPTPIVRACTVAAANLTVTVAPGGRRTAQVEARATCKTPTQLRVIAGGVDGTAALRFDGAGVRGRAAVQGKDAHASEVIANVPAGIPTDLNVEVEIEADSNTAGGAQHGQLVLETVEP